MEKSNNAENFFKLIEKRNASIINSNLGQIKETITEICGRDDAPRLTIDFALISTTNEVTVYNVIVDIKTKVYNCELPY